MRSLINAAEKTFNGCSKLLILLNIMANYRIKILYLARHRF